MLRFLVLPSLLAVSAIGQSMPPEPDRQLARGIYKELVEINTVTATGDSGRAADAMAARLRSAGLDSADVQVFKPAPRKSNLVARLRGTGARKTVGRPVPVYRDQRTPSDRPAYLKGAKNRTLRIFTA